MTHDARDTGYSYQGSVTLTDDLGRVTVFDVAGRLYARTREEAAYTVTNLLRVDIATGTPLGDDEREPGAK